MTVPAFPGPHGHDFGALARCLERFRGEEIVFVPNPGNAGDNLLNLGAYLLFERLGLDIVQGTQAGTYPGRVVVYGGGGSLVPLYPRAGDCLARNHPVAKALVLLPHTVRAHAPILAEMDARCFLFLREAPSRAYAAAAGGGAQLFDSHDLAFLLSEETIAALPWSRRHLLAPRLRGPWARMVLKFALAAKLRDPVLRCLREDAEGTTTTRPRGNADMSRNFATGDMSRGSCVNVAKMLRRVIGMYARVETDRLHIAILSAILGKPVRMMDNSYGKNRAVHDRSIAGYFPRVAFEAHRGSGPSP